MLVRRFRPCLQHSMQHAIRAFPGNERSTRVIQCAVRDRHEIRRTLEAGVDALPEAVRIVFVLCALEGLTVDEAAAALGIPGATVRVRYLRARGLLRAALARDVDATLQDAFAFDAERCDRIVSRVLATIAAGT